LLTDAQFREEFFRAPRLICRPYALDLTATEISALLGIPSLAEFAAQLDARIVRAPVTAVSPAAPHPARSARPSGAAPLRKGSK